METQLVIAENLGYLSEADAHHLANASGEVSRPLHGLMGVRPLDRVAANSKLETGNCNFCWC
jgi:hypothetical protein